LYGAFSELSNSISEIFRKLLPNIQKFPKNDAPISLKNFPRKFSIKTHPLILAINKITRNFDILKIEFYS
jgi:hypothetical protein